MIRIPRKKAKTEQELVDAELERRTRFAPPGGGLETAGATTKKMTIANKPYVPSESPPAGDPVSSAIKFWKTLARGPRGGLVKKWLG